MIASSAKTIAARNVAAFLASLDGDEFTDHDDGLDQMRRATASRARVTEELSGPAIEAHERKIRERMREVAERLRPMEPVEVRVPVFRRVPKVVVSDRGERWGSCIEAGVVLGRCETAVRNAINLGVKAAGRRVWYEKDGPRPLKERPPRAREILRDDGVRFESMAAVVGGSNGRRCRSRHMAISRAIQGGRKFEGHHYSVVPTRAIPAAVA